MLHCVAKRRYQREAIQELPIPQLLQDYLLFLDTELGDGLADMIFESFYFHYMMQPVRREVTYTYGPERTDAAVQAGNT